MTAGRGVAVVGDDLQVVPTRSSPDLKVRRYTVARIMAGIVAAVILVAGARPFAQPRALPAPLEAYVTRSVRLTPAEKSALLSGAPVSKLLDADPTKEVSVFGAVWVNASADAYVARVKDIEAFERGGPFRITKRISEPPQPRDFDALRLSDEDVTALKTCRVGDCEFKLAASVLERVRGSIDWKKPTAKADAEALARQIAHQYVKEYLAGGNDSLAVYRDSERPTFVATEFRSMIDRMPEIAEHLPDLRRYLLDFPRVTLPTATSFLYWQEVQFGLKPTVRINHVVIDDRPEVKAVAMKLLYASHYFWTALDLRVLLPDPARGSGFWFVNVTRSRSDGLTGFVGRLIRGKVQTEAQKGVVAALSATKSQLERR